ncbi:MAG: hypothetical protein RSA01_00450 [Clostridium sp.]|uniref:hypothetical protein n=1 Tax=Clostridium sp. TaxID=1506 RepID=UPI002FC97B1D
MDIATIGIACSVIGAMIGFLTYKLNYNKDIREGAESQSTIAAKLDYILRGVEDIRLDIKAQDRRINELSERLIKVEESTKSAHKRLDSVERNDY